MLRESVYSFNFVSFQYVQRVPVISESFIRHLGLKSWFDRPRSRVDNWSYEMIKDFIDISYPFHFLVVRQSQPETTDSKTEDRDKRIIVKGSPSRPLHWLLRTDKTGNYQDLFSTRTLKDGGPEGKSPLLKNTLGLNLVL